MLTKPEFFRQIVHLLVGIITVVLFYYEFITPWTVFLIVLVGLLLSFIVKRVRVPVISFCLDLWERDEIKKTFPGKGMIFFFIGVLFVTKLFERDIALASIMILALGDSLSHLVGEQFGKIKNIFNGKSQKLLEGTIAGILSGTIGALLFVPFPEAFLGSTAAMIAEVIKIDFNERTLDDNVIVPLVAGTVMYILRNI